MKYLEQYLKNHPDRMLVWDDRLKSFRIIGIDQMLDKNNAWSEATGDNFNNLWKDLFQNLLNS